MCPLPLEVECNGKGRTVFSAVIKIISVMHSTEKKQSKEVKPILTFKKVIRKQEFIEEKSVILCAEEPKVRYLKLLPFYRHKQ